MNSFILKILSALTFMSFVTLGSLLASEAGLVDLGRWNDADLKRIITSAKQLDSPGEQIVALSENFLDSPYLANSMVGGPQKEEELVVNLAGFDCFTLLDVVEALRRASGVEGFTEQLRNVRYRGGEVTYARRRHFFSDWVADDAAIIVDVTRKIGQGNARIVTKQINRKNDDTLWLPEIAVTVREIVYIPTSDIDNQLLSALQPGDYVGIYSDHVGLDVSHTGLIVKDDEKVMLRHASSRSGVSRVVDEDFLNYLQDKPGLVVYRVNPYR